MLSSQGWVRDQILLGLRWNCDFNPLVALRENGRVMVDLGESITDAEKKKITTE